MARKGKWIEGTSPEQPVSVAARRALEVRLAVLWHYLPLAARHADKDIEHVHQLRVATRRAVATLSIFWDVLPKRRASWLKKQLKQVRRAAGEARDDDVLAGRLEKWIARHPAVGTVLKQVRRHRQQAQAPIEHMHRKLVRKRFERRLSELLDRVRWRSESDQTEPCFAAAARSNLRAAVNAFFAASAADLSDVAALHQFRIAGKQLRYAMEVFAEAFRPAFRGDLYPQIEQLQELLGDVNDHATARARLDNWLANAREEELIEALRKLANAEAAALRRSRQKFHSWWTPERAARLKTQFKAHLAPVAGEHAC
jgi:CHAD domain-containing protein